MPEYTGWNKPKKRGPGRPPKKEPEEHTIHSDGTYSNTGVTVSKPTKEKFSEETLKFNDILVINGKRWQARKRLGWGVYMVRIPYKREPGIQDATFFTWEQLEEGGATRA